MKKNNKSAFTLVEILGVIVILSVIVTIVTGSVISYLNKGKDEYNSSLSGQLILAAKNYLADNPDLYQLGDVSSVTVKELLSSNHLSGEVYDADHNICSNKSYVKFSSSENIDNPSLNKQPNVKDLTYTACLSCDNGGYSNKNDNCNIAAPVEYECKYSSSKDKYYLKDKYSDSTVDFSSLTANINGSSKAINNSGIKSTCKWKKDTCSYSALVDDTSYTCEVDWDRIDPPMFSCSGTWNNITVSGGDSSLKYQLYLVNKSTGSAISNITTSKTVGTTYQYLDGVSVDLYDNYPGGGDVEYKKGRYVPCVVDAKKRYCEIANGKYYNSAGNEVTYSQYLNDTTCNPPSSGGSSSSGGGSSIYIPPATSAKEISYTLYKSASCSSASKSSTVYTTGTWACNTVHIYVNNYSDYSSLTYSIDGGSQISMSSGAGTVASEGTHSVVIYGTDKSNYKQTSTTISNIKIDKTAPTLNLSRSRSGTTYGDIWTNGSVTLTATFSDSGGSGLSTIYRSKGCETGSVNISGSTSRAYTYSKPSSDRDCKQYFYVTDNAGNQSTEKYLAVKQDVTGPSCSGTEKDGYVSGNKNYEYTFKDSGTGVKKLEHGHCYNGSVGSINSGEKCSSKSPESRMGGTYTWTDASSSHTKDYNYQYGKGLVYILFDVYDAVGNKTRCTRGTSPYTHSYAHCWNSSKSKTLLNMGATTCNDYLK